MKRILSTLTFVLFILAQSAIANNVVVSNARLTGRDISAGANNPANFVRVQFDVSWENSWRTSSGANNWDAAWIIVKYKVGSGNWQHATMDVSASNHTAPSGSSITPSTDGKGVFIYRNSDGSGSVSYTSVQLRWNYGTDALADTAAVLIKVFAVEMVYVPLGGFSLGSGGGDANSFFTWPDTTTFTPYTVSLEGAITAGTGAGNLRYRSGSNTGDFAGPIPAAFPKGYNAFYCMKYEISQEQYVDFLNTLTYTQQATRTAVAPSSASRTKAMMSAGTNKNRNAIQIQTSGVNSTTPAVYACDLDSNGVFNEAGDGQNISANWLSWMDGAAYADWAALRPMTETEFEKACRGTASAVATEYAWGTTSIAGATGISNSGQSSETASNVGANCVYNNNSSVQGPLRCGSFATSSSDRSSSAGTFYGIMEMSGNVWERGVTVGNVAGRSFTGIHGNGAVTTSGDANVDFWPGINGNSTATTANIAFGGTTGVTEAAGSGFRGGTYDSTVEVLLSNRSVGALTSNTRGTTGTRGLRCVRTAP